MPLFIDNNAFVGNVFADLTNIVEQDGGLGMNDVPGDTSVVRVSYTRERSEQGPARADVLINSTVSNIVITGVDSNFIYTDNFGNSFPINTASGVAEVVGGIIRVVYDINNANGTNYFVFDVPGNMISFPRCVLLFHELSHALNYNNGEGNHAAVAGGTASPAQLAQCEVIAETDENLLRAQKGMALRNVNSHAGGTGFLDGTCPGIAGTTTTPTVGCYIATACYQSYDAPEVLLFRRFRDKVLAKTYFGVKFIQLYYKYSPKLAQKLKNNAKANNWVRRTILDRIYQILKHYEHIL